MSLNAWSVLWEAIAAIGTVGAVGWAMYTTITERRKRTDAENALTAEKASSRIAKRREQAEHVAVWFEVEDLTMAVGDTFHSTPYGKALVGNYSGAPIFNVVVSGDAWLSEQAWVDLGHTRVVPPGSEPWSTDLDGAAEYANELLVQVDFHDVAGVRWRRTSEGKLEEVPGSGPVPSTAATT